MNVCGKEKQMADKRTPLQMAGQESEELVGWCGKCPTSSDMPGMWVTSP